MSDSKTMNAIGLDTNSDGARDASALCELTVPMPKTERPHDLLIRVLAVSVNPVDFKKRNGGAEITGYDVSGIVVESAEDTSLFKAGDAVYYSGDFTRQGANAEYHVVDERIVGRKPVNLSHAEAAAMPLTSLTAWEAMVEQMGIRAEPQANAGKAILIMAGAGGVGSVAIQLAKKVLGLTVVAAASREETAAFARRMGADFIISGRGDLKEELAAVGFESGVEYLFDTVSHTNFERYLLAVKPLGRICSITGAGGLDLGALFMKNITFTTEFVFAKAVSGVNIESQHVILDAMTRLLESGEVVCTLGEGGARPWGVEAMREIQQMLESGKAIGKMVLTREEAEAAAEVVEEAVAAAEAEVAPAAEMAAQEATKEAVNEDAVSEEEPVKTVPRSEPKPIKETGSILSWFYGRRQPAAAAA